MPPVEFQLGSYTLSVKQRLAEGGFGFVDLVIDTNTRQEYVCKRCGVQRKEIFEVVKKEISILQKFAGPYVVKLLASDVITQRSIKEAVLLLEYCAGGHLLERLNNRAGAYLPAPNVYRIFGQLLLGVQPLHESDPPITHRDLKLENILFGTDGNVKLCDFGSCVFGHVLLRNVDERNTAEEIIQKETTQMYRAPEMVDLYMREVLTERTDIWALGCIFYALCFLSHPFQDAGSLGILNAKISMPESAPVAPEARTLISCMLDIDPEARPSIQQLLESFTALATGQPLPAYALSEDALRHRHEREAIAAKRDARNRSTAAKKVATPVVPKKAPAPLASNSVAAKRLAAKRGGDLSVGAIDFDQGPDSGIGGAYTGGFADEGELFGAAPQSAFPSASVTAAAHPSDDFSFDAFGGGSDSDPNPNHNYMHRPSSAASVVAVQDDLLVSFDSSSPDKPLTHQGIWASSGGSNHSNSSGVAAVFDPFGGGGSSVAAGAGNGGGDLLETTAAADDGDRDFGTTAGAAGARGLFPHSGSGLADSFGDDPFSTTAASGTTYAHTHTTTAASSVSGSVFGISDDFSQISLQHPATATSTTGGFDEFFSTGAASNPSPRSQSQAQTNIDHTFDAFSSSGSNTTHSRAVDHVFESFPTTKPTSSFPTTKKPTNSSSSSSSASLKPSFDFPPLHPTTATAATTSSSASSSTFGGTDFLSSSPPPILSQISASPSRGGLDDIFSSHTAHATVSVHVSAPATHAATHTATHASATRVLDLFDSSNEPEREKDVVGLFINPSGLLSPSGLFSPSSAPPSSSSSSSSFSSSSSRAAPAGTAGYSLVKPQAGPSSSSSSGLFGLSPVSATPSPPPAAAVGSILSMVSPHRADDTAASHSHGGHNHPHSHKEIKDVLSLFDQQPSAASSASGSYHNMMGLSMGMGIGMGAGTIGSPTGGGGSTWGMGNMGGITGSNLSSGISSMGGPPSRGTIPGPLFPGPHGSGGGGIGSIGGLGVAMGAGGTGAGSGVMNRGGVDIPFPTYGQSQGHVQAGSVSGGSFHLSRNNNNNSLLQQAPSISVPPAAAAKPADPFESLNMLASASKK